MFTNNVQIRGMILSEDLSNVPYNDELVFPVLGLPISAMFSYPFHTAWSSQLLYINCSFEHSCLKPTFPYAQLV